MKIGVFDSGVGGLTVWREIARQIPGVETLYLADQAHAPYGDRSLDEARTLTEGSARFLLARGAQAIVIACNTASAAALHHLRRTFPDIPFVGMEPAVKPAVERTRNGVIGVIATRATFQGELFANLVARYGKDARVLTQACPGLVEAVEAGALDTPETEALLRRYLAPLIEAGVDQLALGCTHYPFLRPLIERIVGEGVAVIDPAPAVALQTKRVLMQHGWTPPTSDAPAAHVFYTTGDAPAFRAALERLLSPALRQNIRVQQARWREGQGEIGPQTHSYHKGHKGLTERTA